jgi:hypothetical protein
VLEGDGERTVGGGLGEPSESSTFVLVRFASCSSKKARSSRILSIDRCILDNLRRAASLASSTSFMRAFNSIHLRLYDSSTDGGSVGGFFDTPLDDMVMISVRFPDNVGKGFDEIMRPLCVCW